ncbi:MAG: hypothetical protein QM817_06750 [Archangium sp.]
MRWSVLLVFALLLARPTQAMPDDAPLAAPLPSGAGETSTTPRPLSEPSDAAPSALASSESDAAPTPEFGTRIWPAFVLGGLGAALAGGYIAGAYATGDRPSGLTLGVSGGIVTGGILGAGIALGIGALRKDPGSLLRYILVPVLSGLAGAAVGGLAAGLGTRVPGTARTVTHVVIVSLLLAETVTILIAR